MEEEGGRCPRCQYGIVTFDAGGRLRCERPGCGFGWTETPRPKRPVCPKCRGYLEILPRSVTCVNCAWCREVCTRCHAGTLSKGTTSDGSLRERCANRACGYAVTVPVSPLAGDRPSPSEELAPAASAALCQRRREGWTIRRLSREYGISIRHVYRLLREDAETEAADWPW